MLGMNDYLSSDCINVINVVRVSKRSHMERILWVPLNKFEIIFFYYLINFSHKTLTLKLKIYIILKSDESLFE